MSEAKWYRHGGTNTKTYSVWEGMIKRCTNPKAADWSYYGGRGIKVCDRWRKFENFISDMGERPSEMTIDRINHNGNYEPENCRWATRLEQNQNTRSNRMITFNGETKCLAEWARRTGIKESSLWRRLFDLGWPIEKALTTTVKMIRRPSHAMNSIPPDAVEPGVAPPWGGLALRAAPALLLSVGVILSPTGCRCAECRKFQKAIEHQAPTWPFVPHEQPEKWIVPVESGEEYLGPVAYNCPGGWRGCPNGLPPMTVQSQPPLDI